ncbi:MAG: DUF732 domain-containing protein [Mycetocola sp.]
MNKLVATTAAIAFALLLTGCGAAQQTNELEGVAKFAASADETETTSKATPTEPAVDITAPGEVCDPEADDDFPCLAADPDLAVVKMTGQGRAGEPLISLPDADRIALAHAACDALANGGTSETVSLIETTDPARPATANNFAIFSAGAAAYCPEFAEEWVQDELEAAQAG